MPDTLSKYRRGFQIMMVAVLLLTAYIVIDGLSRRQDNATDAAAHTIASKLNNYSQVHASVPPSLTAAGVASVPSTISYQQTNDSNYQLCETYKSANNGSSSSYLPKFIRTRLSSLFISKAAVHETVAANGVSNVLVIGTHKKGINCQTVNLTENSTSSGL